ncbi:uncharacterized protein LOC124809266 [Hydra vulgaris]|uniref:uncharacterized protein LOC124809266 n=1 Tax=Hydra vulgaris TaxID=6087 RepID=UPI001F5E61A6|nr:uncharacterized protein LOC124809266 [Hydra vulgaris]
MADKKDLVCQLQFRDSAKYPNNLFLIASIEVNVILTLISNAALIFGLYNTTRSKKYTRNKKLVMLLSVTDIINALVVSTSQIVLLKRVESCGCLEISIIIFFRFWFLGVTCSIFLMICLERFITVVYNNKICGIYVKDSYSVGYLIFVAFATLIAGICNGFIYATLNLYLHFLLYIGTGSLALIFLIMIVVTNVLMLHGVKSNLRNRSLEFQRNAAIENHLTKTVVITSLAHVFFFCPFIAAQFYMSFIVSKNETSLISPAHKILMWTVVLRKSSSWFNATIYTLRSRKISKLYVSKINSIFRSCSGRSSLTTKEGLKKNTNFILKFNRISR